MLPHVFYFQGVPELFVQLMDMEVMVWMVWGLWILDVENRHAQACIASIQYR